MASLSSNEIGRLGEKLAVEYLKKHQYAIVATNFTLPLGLSHRGRPISGEIDIIAYDRSTKTDILAFIEVKTRTSAELIAPQAAVDLRKQRRIVRVSRAYRRLMGLMEVMGVHDEPYRFDVVTILLDPLESPQISCLQGYFDDRLFFNGSRQTDFLT